MIAPDSRADRALPALIVLLVSTLALGLLAAAQSLQLPWMAGQALVLAAMIMTLAVITTDAYWRSGPQALARIGRMRQTGYAVVALLVVVLPVYQYQQHPGNGHGAPFPFTVALALGLCLLALGMASDLNRCWSELHEQPWERKTTHRTAWDTQDPEAAGRVDRASLVAGLWRWWLGGTLALALALLLCSLRPAATPAWVPVTVSAAFALYLLSGLIVLSEAARLRQTVYWELEEIAVAPALAGRWSRHSLAAALAVFAGVAALLLFRVLDLAGAVESWLLWQVIVPLMRRLGDFLDSIQNGGSCNGSSCSESTGPRALPLQHGQSRIPARPSGKPIDLSWLANHWPLLLGLAALLVLTRSIIVARREGGGGRFWRNVLAALLRDLRRLLQALRGPALRMVSEAGGRIGRRAAALARGEVRRGGRRAEHGPRQLIIALYLAAIRYGTRRGCPRRPGQTPREYAAEFSARIPTAGEAIREMTDIFVEVRYSAQQPRVDSVSRMKDLWKILRN